MKSFLFSVILVISSLVINSFNQGKGTDPGCRQIYIEWKDRNPVGTIETLNGELLNLKVIKGDVKIKNNWFEFTSPDNNRLLVSFNTVNNNPGSDATLVTVNTGQHPFSFFLRDVTSEFPVYIPEYKVIVLQGDDMRTYDEVAHNIQSRKIISKLQQIENEPEESFENVKNRTRNQTVPTWLGISRDVRIFQLSQSLEDSPAETDIISPRFSSTSLTLPETNNSPVNYLFGAGRGQGVESNISRHLDNGILPILHSQFTDGEINYHSIFFAALESIPLKQTSFKGTDFYVADNYSSGHMFTEEQQEIVNKKLKEFEKEHSEQTVLYCRIKARNTGKVPRYAWFKNPRPGRSWWDNRTSYTFDQANGFSLYSEDRIFCVSKLNDETLSDEETALLLKPDETVTFDFFIPHSPISKERAIRLSEQSFETRYLETKKFWEIKLNDAAQIQLPEKRIEEMLRAGLLHLDLITYGEEPNGTLAPLIGVYSPIGTESSPIIQFYCSMGLHDIAKRSLLYFLEKQHEDGLIQNFNGYMIETGAALWSMGEYFRYSKDKEWVKEVHPKLIKSCNYLLDWRERNKTEASKGKGYGMIDGKAADVDNPYRSFMVNAYGYIGIKRVAEMLETIDPGNSQRLKEEAENWKKDILAAFCNSMAYSPVVPTGDGTWCPTMASYADVIGPQSLYVNKRTCFSHGTFTGADALVGPLYLVFCEILEPADELSKMMLKYHSELFYQNNSAFSQPYYSRHNWIQLKLGLVKPFLKTYYNTFSALADRETYTFWEHLYHVAPHKTHEEAWFLMETRWMLYLENGDTLNLFSGIPRKWLEDGNTIRLKNVASYYGLLSTQVDSRLSEGIIVASIKCNSDNKPENVIFRLPHPGGKKPVKVEGGNYDYNSETITITSFKGEAEIRMEF